MAKAKVMTKKQVERFLDNLMYRSLLDRENVDEAYKELARSFKQLPQPKEPKPETHKQIHKRLHQGLDELAADYLGHTKNLLSDTTVIDLMKWSHYQTLKPTEIK